MSPPGPHEHAQARDDLRLAGVFGIAAIIRDMPTAGPPPPMLFSMCSVLPRSSRGNYASIRHPGRTPRRAYFRQSG
jgi:hypothetical protein